MSDDSARTVGPSRSIRSERTIPERLALLEVGMDDLRSQRDREHGENQKLLHSIDDNVRTINDKMTTVGRRQDVLEADHTRIDGRIDDLEAWRAGLTSEIRGAMKIPKLILAATPVAMAVFAVWTFLHP